MKDYFYTRQLFDGGDFSNINKMYKVYVHTFNLEENMKEWVSYKVYKNFTIGHIISQKKEINR